MDFDPDYSIKIKECLDVVKSYDKGIIFGTKKWCFIDFLRQK